MPYHCTWVYGLSVLERRRMVEFTKLPVARANPVQIVPTFLRSQGIVHAGALIPHHAGSVMLEIYMTGHSLQQLLPSPENLLTSSILKTANHAIRTR